MKQIKILASLLAVSTALFLAGCGDSKKAPDAATPAAADAPAAAPEKAAVPLINLADENATFFLYVKDMPSLLKKWEGSPWAKTWNDAQVKKFFAPLHARIDASGWQEKLKAETGLSPEEFIELIQGDCLVSIGDISAFKDFDHFGDDPETFPLIIAGEIGKNKDKIEKIIADALKKENTPVQTETYAGVTINIAETKTKQGNPNPFVWAITGDKIFFSPSKAFVISTIDALKNGGAANALGKSARYLSMVRRTGDSQILYALNFRALYPMIDAAFAKKGASDKRSGIDYTKLAANLGLDALGDIYLGVNLADDRTESSGAVTYNDKHGLLKLLSFAAGSLEIPEFAASSWPGLAVNNYSIPEAIAAIEEIAAAISPGSMGFVDTQLQQINTMLGIDIRRDFIGSLGERVVTANVLPAGVTMDDSGITEKIGTLYVIDLKDARAFSGVIEAVKTNPQIGPSLRIAERDYLGVTLNTIKTRPGAKPFTFAVAKNQFLLGVGSPTIVEAAVQGLTNGAASAMKDRADVRNALSEAPASANSFSVQDMRFMLRLICDMLPLFTRGETGEIVDPAAMPDSAVFEKYWGNIYGWTAAESDGFHFSSKVLYKK